MGKSVTGWLGFLLNCGAASLVRSCWCGFDYLFDAGFSPSCLPKLFVTNGRVTNTSGVPQWLLVASLLLGTIPLFLKILWVVAPAVAIRGLGAACKLP